MLKPKFYLLTLILFGMNSISSAQNFKSIGGAGKFYFQPQLKALACQIDGDGASGYNKIGYSIGVNTGYTLGDFRSVEWGISFSERGSQRGINPELGMFNPFHIRLNHLDGRLSYHQWYEQFLLGAGVQIHLLTSAKEEVGIAPRIEEDYRSISSSIWVSVRYELSEKWSAEATASYSLFSMVKNGGIIRNPLYPAGVYSNNIGLGLIFTP
jgi:hypothetical protein